MTKNNMRNYNCKDEELPVICNFAGFSLKRDLADFTAFSPMFNNNYLVDFEAKTKAAFELVEPKSETNVLKTITKQLYATMDDLISPINYLKGYIELASDELNLNPDDLGLTNLRKAINSRDTESVLKNLHLVNAAIVKYNTILSPHGLNEQLIDKFTNAYTAISAGKQQRFEITSGRAAIVQNNLGAMNGLYDQLTQILKTGKILYKQTDEAKLKEYSFSQLMKQVRRVSNNVNEPINEATEAKTT